MYRGMDLHSSVRKAPHYRLPTEKRFSLLTCGNHLRQQGQSWSIQYVSEIAAAWPRHCCYKLHCTLPAK